MSLAATSLKIGKGPAVALATALLGGCSWIGLGWNALQYPVSGSGESANVVAAGHWAYATRGAGGIEILDLSGSPKSKVLPLPAGVDSADDLAIADGLLFVLDAQMPGYLAVFSLAKPGSPQLMGSPVPVEVGPFSGVSAAGGKVVVSGGTSRLSVRRYDRAGQLGVATATADFGRGQPDVLLNAAGNMAFVSTHDWGPYFSLSIARLFASPLAVQKLAALRLETFGFTPGGFKPANFPIEAAIAGSVVYLATRAGLGVIDVTNPVSPQWLARIEVGVQPVNVDVQSGEVALVGSVPSPKLVLVDVRDPAHPEILQSFPLPKGSLATGVVLTASHAVVAAHGQGTLLFNRMKGDWESAVPF